MLTRYKVSGHPVHRFELHGFVVNVWRGECFNSEGYVMARELYVTAPAGMSYQQAAVLAVQRVSTSNRYVLTRNAIMEANYPP